MSSVASDTSARVAALREEVRALAHSPRAAVSCLPFGVPDIDARLATGGLAGSALHEVAGGTTGPCDDAAASFFAAGVATRAAGGGSVLWILSRPDLFAPGLAGAGLPAHRLIHVDAGKDADALAVMEEGLRHGGLAAVVCEVARADMTATRRLQLVAEEGGTIGILLRRWRRAAVDPLTVNSAAATRWRIGCAPSARLPVAGVGRPRWNVSLVRQRGGESHDWLLEGCDAQGCLALPAERRDRPAAPDRCDDRQAA